MTKPYAELSYLRGYRRGASMQNDHVPPETHSGAFMNGFRDGRADYEKAERVAQHRAVLGIAHGTMPQQSA